MLVRPDCEGMYGASREKVLMLLPTPTSKLLVPWHEPYDVVKRVGKVTYQVDMADKKK